MIFAARIAAPVCSSVVLREVRDSLNSYKYTIHSTSGLEFNIEEFRNIVKLLFRKRNLK
jgi:hypothetical protein